MGGFLPSEECERQRVFPSQVAPQPHTVNAFPAQKNVKKCDENFENIMKTCKEMMKDVMIIERWDQHYFLLVKSFHDDSFHV